MFLDDGLGCSRFYESTARLGSIIKTDILNSGFIPNATKCIWLPVQNLEFLGCNLDTLEGFLSIPNRRLCKTYSTINELIVSVKNKLRVSVRKVASAVGQLISMSVVIGNISQIMT
jgi:hypothetical protein